MAQIPTLDTPRNEITVTPQETLRTGSLGPGTGGAFRQAGASLSAEGAALAEADRRLRERGDALRRIEAMNSVDTEARKQILAAQTGGNLGVPSEVAKLRASLKSLYDRTAQGLPGDLTLAAQLAKSHGNFDASVVEMGIQTGKALITQAHDEVINKGVQTILNSPGSFPDVLSEHDIYFFDNVAPTLPEAEQAEALRSGRERLATASIEFLVTTGQYGKATERLNDPNVVPFLSSGKQLELRLRVLRGEGEAKKIRAVAREKIKLLTDIGLDKTDPQLFRKAVVAAVTGVNLQSRRTTLTLPEKIQEATDAVRKASGDPNRELTLKQVEKLGQVDARERGEFGASETGLARNIVLELGPKIRDNTLTVEEFDLFFGAVSAIRAERPDGSRGELDLNTRDLLSQLDVDADKISAAKGVEQFAAARARLFGGPQSELIQPQVVQPVDGGAAPDAARDLSEAGQQSLSSLGGKASRFNDALAGAEVGQELQALADSGATFFSVVDDLTGMVSGAKVFLGGTEPLGRLFSFPEIAAIRQAFDVWATTVLPIFRQTRRFGKGELDEVKKRVRAVQGSFGKPPDFLRGEMAGLAMEMRRMRASFQQTLDKEGEVSGERFRDLQDRVDQIDSALISLGIPRGMGISGELPKAETPEEAEKLIKDLGLRPGDVIIYQGDRATINHPVELKEE